MLINLVWFQRKYETLCPAALCPVNTVNTSSEDNCLIQKKISFCCGEMWTMCSVLSTPLCNSMSTSVCGSETRVHPALSVIKDLHAACIFLFVMSNNNFDTVLPVFLFYYHFLYLSDEIYSMFLPKCLNILTLLILCASIKFINEIKL